MVRKAFLIFLSVEILILLFGFAIKHLQPEAPDTMNIEEFPLKKDAWTGVRDDLVPEFVEMLNPTAIFSATYTNGRGRSVHLFFDYFAGQSNPGGPHSPRNCVPGSGWIISKESEHRIDIKGRNVNIGRFYFRRESSEKVMDFWYITRYGETANDYLFKFYSMISSLTFRPNDIAFVRIISDSDDESLESLKEFENIFAEEIYGFLGY